MNQQNQECYELLIKNEDVVEQYKKIRKSPVFEVARKIMAGMPLDRKTRLLCELAEEAPHLDQSRAVILDVMSNSPEYGIAPEELDDVIESLFRSVVPGFKIIEALQSMIQS